MFLAQVPPQPLPPEPVPEVRYAPLPICLPDLTNTPCFPQQPVNPCELGCEVEKLSEPKLFPNIPEVKLQLVRRTTTYRGQGRR